MAAAVQEAGAEFIVIGKGAIASEAIDQQLADDPGARLRLVQDSGSILDARDADQNGKLNAKIGDLPVVPGAKRLTELEEPVEATTLLDGVKFALEATPYSAHEDMAELIPLLHARGILTIMASKGFMAEHPEEALDVYLAGYLGPDATLGGNTGIFPFFDSISDDRTVSFEGIVNGTFSRMFDLMRSGKSAEEILATVRPRTKDNPRGEGLAEPGATTLLQLLHGEHEDNLGKAVNAYNFGILPNDSGEIDGSEIARIGDAQISEITEEQAEALFADPHDMAYVVNWHRDGGEIPEEYYDASKVPGVITLEVGDSGLIVGGFRKVPETSRIHVITQRPGPLNGMSITKKIKSGRGGWDRNAVIGTGAGAIPTAHRMVLNSRALRMRHNRIAS